MGTWNEFLQKEGTPPEWPYPIKFGEEKELEADVLVLGGGIAGCWAAITAARNGAKAVIMEKGDVRRSGAGGPGCDHWCNVPANPHSRRGVMPPFGKGRCQAQRDGGIEPLPPAARSLDPSVRELPAKLTERAALTAPACPTGSRPRRPRS